MQSKGGQATPKVLVLEELDQGEVRVERPEWERGQGAKA